MPVPVLMAWVVVTPFAVMAAVARSSGLRRCVERCYVAALLAGWAGFAIVAAGALVGDRGLGTVAIAVGAPLLGLCVWVRRAPDDGGEPAPAPEPGDPPDAIDWDRFMRDLEEWSSSRAGASRR
jgi:hypothetical protein